jgi:protein SCO1/2
MAYAYVQLRATRPNATPSPPLSQLAKAPNFELIAHDGRKLSNADLSGKIWVVNFIFTRCKGPCPAITSRMAELQQKLGRTRPGEIQLLSLTVDPAHDTPGVLAEYAKAVGADPSRWRFATGPAAQVEDIIRNGFLQSLLTDDSAELVHSSRFVVVDREGWMRGFPDGNDPEVVQKLLMDIGDLLREGPENR